MKWEKPPTNLIEFLKNILKNTDCEKRIMFGVPTGFINGNMFLGAHQQFLILRLSQEDIKEVLAKYRNSKRFEPMSGRVMKEYIALPAELYDREEIFNELLKKSIVYVLLSRQEERRNELLLDTYSTYIKIEWPGYLCHISLYIYFK